VTAEHSDPRVAQPWEQLDQRPRTDGWLPIVTRTYRMPDGSVSEWDIHLPSFTTVAVLALTDDDRVVLVRQFRPGPGQVLMELPGGVVDPGESPVEAARRELLEESGYAARTVEQVWGSPAAAPGSPNRRPGAATSTASRWSSPSPSCARSPGRGRAPTSTWPTWPWTPPACCEPSSPSP
jgi:ADP-ribose pyrophosphatase